ncbi:MAG TPA: Rossmann-like and DUF2520 domain-containing protein [Pyrinomonadaceae bacterium]|nr:Rossmann-like and DUF2520 domain-containing protein [Pyrinomonadaceae bacterium]
MPKSTTGSLNRKQGPKSKLSVAIIGSGRLGTALGLALTRAGYRVPIVASLHSAHARRAANLIGRKTKHASLKNLGRAENVDELAQADLIIIATSDDAIETVTQQLVTAIRTRSKDNRRRPPRRIALHTSGALGAKVLDPLKREGFVVGSIHPLISISDPATGADWLARAYFSLAGDSKAVTAGRRLVRRLGGQSFQIRPEMKALYHAAALMASPNLTALFDIALEMLTRCGISPTRAHHVLLPLVESTLANLATQDPRSALTGTFKRGDLATTIKHIKAIKAEKLIEALQAYVVLGNRSLTLANHPRNEQEMRRLLSDATENR